MRYQTDLISQARKLRSEGMTYSEIKLKLNFIIPKSTMFSWFKDTRLPENYPQRVRQLNVEHLKNARLINIERNKERRTLLIKNYQDKNQFLVKKIDDIDISKIGLAMLWLGEGSKHRGVFCLGSSDPRIIKLFLWFIKKCYQFQIEKVRCTVQCRADQDILELEKYWMGITNIPKRLFYKARIDPRTIGKPTSDSNYKGVLRVDYFDVSMQDEMATIVNMLYNQISSGPEV